MTIELDREEDGHWIAEALEVPGVMCYGRTRDEAVSNTERLAIEVIADRIAHHELPSSALSLSFAVLDEQQAASKGEAGPRRADTNWRKRETPARIRQVAYLIGLAGYEFALPDHDEISGPHAFASVEGEWLRAFRLTVYSAVHVEKPTYFGQSRSEA